MLIFSSQPSPVQANDLSVTITAVSTTSNEEIAQNKIVKYASIYNVDPTEMYKVVSCETANTFDPMLQSRVIRKDGTQEKSFGLAQIYLPMHPEISKDQATDSDFALDFMAKQFSIGHKRLWSCYTQLKTQGVL